MKFHSSSGSDQPVAVAIVADLLMEKPLYAFLFSLISHTPRFLKIYFFYDDFRVDDLQRLESKLRSRQDNFVLVFIRIRPSVGSNWRRLHGSAYPFVKFFIPQHIKEPRVLYLDVDMIVGLDVAELFDQDLCGCTLGAAGIGPIAWALEREFYRDLGLAQNESYFNAGMLLIDVPRWEKERITEQCIAFSNQYPTRLASADQSVLNFVFYRKFTPLPDRFNLALFPTERPPSVRLPAIYHFVGSPKPWDFGGRWLNKHHAFYDESLRQLGEIRPRFSWIKLYKKLRRSFRISRQYSRCIRLLLQ